jgi:putative membrane protein
MHPVIRLMVGLGMGMGLLGFGASAAAHSPFGGAAQEQLSALLTALVLAAFWGMYVRGSWQRPPGTGSAVLFHGVAVLAAAALVGPLDDLAKTGSAMHMSQHMLLIVVIAPLWVLARPLPQIVAGGGKIAALFWKPMLRLSAYPMWATYLHGATIWFWHVPYFYMLAAENPWWHAIAHAFLLVTAGVFWWAVLRAGQRGAPWALLAALVTLMHTGFLGALLTFTRAPLYGEARDLPDQQLAGLIMWVLGGLPYIIASVWIGYRWFRQLEAGAGRAGSEA